MNYPDHSWQTLSNQANVCANSLRLFCATDIRQKADVLLLINDFEDLARSCTQKNINSFRLIAERTGQYLQSRIDSVVPVPPVETETLNLTASWLEHLSHMHSTDLPIPNGVLADLLYNFDLLEHASFARNNAPLNDSGAKCPAKDLFFDDPALVVSDPSSNKRLDPFADHPDFGSLSDSSPLDLLHRTMRISDASTTVPLEDPFGDDELLSVTEMDEFEDHAVPPVAHPVEDLFADDPQLEDSK